jgi:hypothetical protein
MGFKHVGKKVETSELRLDKNVFFEKARAVLGFKRLVIDTQGRANNEIVGRRKQVLSDNDDALTTDVLDDGILVITPTADRTKSTPTATQLIENILDVDGEAITAASYEAFEFSIINLSTGRTITLSAGTGVTLVGNMTVAISSSGRFQMIKISTAAVELYRLA